MSTLKIAGIILAISSLGSVRLTAADARADGAGRSDARASQRAARTEARAAQRSDRSEARATEQAARAQSRAAQASARSQARAAQPSPRSQVRTMQPSTPAPRRPVAQEQAIISPRERAAQVPASVGTPQRRSEMQAARQQQRLSTQAAREQQRTSAQQRRADTQAAQQQQRLSTQSAREQQRAGAQQRRADTQTARQQQRLSTQSAREQQRVGAQQRRADTQAARQQQRLSTQSARDQQRAADASARQQRQQARADDRRGLTDSRTGFRSDLNRRRYEFDRNRFGYAADVRRNAWHHRDRYYGRNWGHWGGHRWHHDDWWRPLAWAGLSSFLTFGLYHGLHDYDYYEPVYYSYGGGYGRGFYGPDELIIVNDVAVAPTRVYVTEAAQTARLYDELAAASTSVDDWKPLGIYALTDAARNVNVDDPDRYMELVISKDGAIGGTYHDLLEGEDYPIHGAVDPKTQRAAWRVGNFNDVFETGIYNLTQPETAALQIRSTGAKQIVLIRIQDPQLVSSIGTGYTAR